MAGTKRKARTSKPLRPKAKRMSRVQVRRVLRDYSTKELVAFVSERMREQGGRVIGKGGTVRGRFDAAQTNEHNRRHWADADALSADAAANPAVRSILRQRSRYEVANNSYARGLILTLANDTIGRGPRLQLLTGQSGDGLTREDARRIEASFGAWAKQVRLAAKLRLMRSAKLEDGEAFAVKVTNESLKHAVKLDIRLIEADQVATPDLWTIGQDRDAVDGIRFDSAGNPVVYHVLKDHPGTDKFSANPNEYIATPADLMVHWFRADRPGQRRGIPEITPALPLFSALRRFTLAVVATAEKAAAIAGVIESDALPGENADLDPFEQVDLNMSEILTLPSGWKLNPLSSEQPTTSYGMFKAELLGEIGRSVLAPYNITAGNSSGYNYSSGRLDHQVYDVALAVERDDCEAVVLDNLFAAWLEEAVLIEGLLPQSMRRAGAIDELPPHRWFWDGRPDIDIEKTARAEATRLQNSTTTLAAEYAAQGKDWEEELEQRGRELERMRELGIPVPSAHDNTGRPLDRGGDEPQDQDGEPPAGGRAAPVAAAARRHPRARISR